MQRTYTEDRVRNVKSMFEGMKVLPDARALSAEQRKAFGLRYHYLQRRFYCPLSCFNEASALVRASTVSTVAAQTIAA